MTRLKTMQAGLLLATAWAGIAVYAGGGPITVEMDPVKTRIDWTLGDVLHTVHGTFQLKQGRIIYDPAGQSISGELIVETASGESGNDARDRKMKREILETQKFPDARFIPVRIDAPISMTGLSEAHVSGRLDLHGTKHDLTIPMKTEISGSDLKATGSFMVPYVEWGMKNPSTFVLRVDQAVRVNVTATGHLSRSTALNVMSF